MKAKFILLAIAATLPLFGCGNSDPAPPPGAMRPPTPPSSGKVPMTKEEKIAAINKAPIPEDQKKAEIAKVNAGN